MYNDIIAKRTCTHMYAHYVHVHHKIKTYLLSSLVVTQSDLSTYSAGILTMEKNYQLVS